MSDFVVGSQHTIERTLKRKDTGVAINLDGASVAFKYRLEGAAVQSKTATVTDSANGVVEYTLTASDWGNEGYVDFGFIITDSEGKIHRPLKLEHANLRRALL